MALGDALSSALSGLQAAQTRLDVSASNIANISSDGALPNDFDATAFGSASSGTNTSTPPSTGSQKPVYIPYEVEQTSAPPVGPNNIPSGVATTVRQVTPGYTVKFDPGASYANAKGEVAAPDVDEGVEMVGMLAVSSEFKANLKVTQTISQMLTRMYYDLGDDE